MSSTPKLLQPSPTTETSMPELPSLPFFMGGSLRGQKKKGAGCPAPQFCTRKAPD
jgi:hypothetical protein